MIRETTARRLARPVPASVLVSGAGGAAGIGAIKALRMAGYRGQIVATDADPLAAGLELADLGAVLPRAADAEFLPRAVELIRREHVEVILPTSAFDTPVYAAHRHELQAAGAVLVGCDAEVIDTCLDAWRLHERLAPRFPLPRATRGRAPEVGFPCVVKPVCRRGRRGATVCLDVEALEHRLREGDEVVIQEYLPGAEYAVDVLADLDGHPLVAVPRLRLAVNDGISMRGQVVHDDEVEMLCLKLAGALGVKGPVCVQLKRDRAGALRVLEVQPRLGGAAFFSALAGLNLAALCLDIAVGRALPALRFSEIAVVRYFEEIVVIGEDRRRRRRPTPVRRDGVGPRPAGAFGPRCETA